MKFFVIKHATLIIASFMLISCGTNTLKNPQTIQVRSYPEKVNLTIIDEDDKLMFKGTTPVDIPLRKSDGYFMSKDYFLNFDKYGYQPLTIELKTTTSSNYLFGNLAFGGYGLIGWLIVDPATGNMWTFENDLIMVELQADTSRVYLLENVESKIPEEELVYDNDTGKGSISIEGGLSQRAYLIKRIEEICSTKHVLLEANTPPAPGYYKILNEELKDGKLTIYFQATH